MIESALPGRSSYERDFVQALLDFESFPGRYAVALREPRVLFDGAQDVLALASGRDVANLRGDPGSRRRLREAARFFVRTGMLRQGSDAYTLLGIPHGFDAAVLRDNYRMLIRLTHPDFMGKEEMAWPADAATRINMAHDTLSSPEKKRQYDASLKPAFGPAAGSATRSVPIPVARRRAIAPNAAPFRLGRAAGFARRSLKAVWARIPGPPTVLSSVVAAVSASALTYWLVQDDGAPEVVASAAQPLRLELERNVSRVSLYRAELPSVPTQSLSAPVQSGLRAAPALEMPSRALPNSHAPSGSQAPVQLAAAEIRPPIGKAPESAFQPSAARTEAVLASTNLPAPAILAPAAVQAPVAIPVPVAPPSTPMPVVVQPDPPTPIVPPTAVAVAVAAPFGAPVAPSRMSMADVQPVLTALVGALQSGRGDDAFQWAEPSVRRGDGAEFMQAYHRARNGARVIGVGQVSFRGTASAGQLIVEGSIQVYMQDESQRTILRDIQIRAHFSSRDGTPVLTRLALADPRS